ncbi:hypothetical protein BZA77DRAFT_354008 [Pyronema omphalodes]|nr:hypothetical protein BZA77DRAFT_354008 [Pyronema omphalodes]
MAWECHCLFINPEAAEICSWCDKPREEHNPPINKDETNHEIFVPDPQTVIMEQSRSTPGFAADEAKGHSGKRIESPQRSTQGVGAWECGCLFINSGKASACSWCEAPRPRCSVSKEEELVEGGIMENCVDAHEEENTASTAVTAGGSEEIICVREQDTPALVKLPESRKAGATLDAAEIEKPTRNMEAK